MAASSDPYPWQEPVSKPARGAFIVIEGLDRAGKTTQVKRLCDKLYKQGHNIKTIRFPGIYPFLIFNFFWTFVVLISAEVGDWFGHIYKSVYVLESLFSSVVNLFGCKIPTLLICSILCNVTNPQFEHSLGLQTHPCQMSLVLVNPNITDQQLDHV